MTTSPTPHLTVRCHRRLRGPYTGGGALLRSVVPELAERDPKAVAARAHAVVAIAPDLAHLAGTAPRTLTNSAERGERTRLYSVSRTRRLAHSLAELLLDWARLCHPGGAVVALRELDDADPTDHELVDVLRRRCDPAVLTVVTDVTGVACLTDATDVTDVTDVADRTDGAGGTDGADGAHPAEPGAASATAAGPDPARRFIDSDGTSRDAAARTAYDALPADERARLHEERAARLAAADGPAVRLGALPYHLERGTDPAGAGADALAEAAETAFLRGFYEAALDYCLRGRTALGTARPKHYWTVKI
ncbi:hypothetical protein [Streptomyces sp. NPDC056160]|uniref:hypothetical protein n=1 Tax=Streptomyces sp. NPDC056160 TaxID=3345731 RepID=UPI0035DA96B2